MKLTVSVWLDHVVGSVKGTLLRNMNLKIKSTNFTEIKERLLNIHIERISYSHKVNTANWFILWATRDCSDSKQRRKIVIEASPY